MEELGVGHPQRGALEQILAAGDRGRDLVRQLMAFARQQPADPKEVKLDDLLLARQGLLRKLLRPGVQFDLVLEAKAPAVLADPVQLEQVLMNLVINARDAMPNGGKVSIETANVDVDDFHAQQHPKVARGRYVLLTVTDTGTGMDLETQSHIYEPFFSTKAPGSGTGLGLSTVFGIVKDSGGTIGVYSEPGHGTTFRIYFPRCDKAPVVPQPDKARPLRGGTETILLVDDCKPLRMLTKMLLEPLGYTVLSCGDSGEAFRVAGEHSGTLPLLITDVVMPGLSGPMLADKVASIRPDTKVLFTSGYTADEFARNGAPGTERAFLTKPFSRDDLVRKVREVLDS